MNYPFKGQLGLIVRHQSIKYPGVAFLSRRSAAPLVQLSSHNINKPVSNDLSFHRCVKPPFIVLRNNYYGIMSCR